MEDIVKVEDLSEIEKKIYINVTPDIVNEKFNDFFKNIKSEAQVPGFRKGKVPNTVLKKYFKTRALSTISQMLVSEYYQNAIRDFNINPVSNPIIKNQNDKNKHIGEFSSDNSYSVEIIVEVLPKIEPVGYDDIELVAPEYNFDELCDKKMLNYQEQFAERRNLLDEETIKFDDSVQIDYKASMDGEQIEERDGVLIEKLGSGLFPINFEEQLVGLKVNDTPTIKVVYPDDYSIDQLKNKEVEFNIKINNVIRKISAAVDDDLALMSGFDSVDNLKEFIKEDVKKDINNNNKRLFEEKIINIILEKNDFEVPASLLKNEGSRILKQSNILNPNDKALEQVGQAALVNLKKSILLDAIYSKENIDISPEELNEKLEEQALKYNKDKDEIVSMLYNSNQMDAFVSVLKFQKVIDHIININLKKDEEGND